MKKNSAFSLIELSVVLIIIGLLIAGIIGGKELINVSKLSGARSLTSSSPVAGIEDLVLWLETTSKKSFDNSDINAATPLVGTWYDINPQKTSRNNATAAGVARPTYSKGSINGLPALSFNGTSNYFTLDPTLLPTGASARTMFFVVKDSQLEEQTLLNYGTDTAEKRISITSSPTTFACAVSGHNFGNNGLDNSGSNIFTMTFIESGTSNQFVFFKNGQLLTPSNIAGGSQNVNTGATYAYIATDATLVNYFQGNVGEVIIFNRDLAEFERKEVELYLSKKWGIKITY